MDDATLAVLIAVFGTIGSFVYARHQAHAAIDKAARELREAAHQFQDAGQAMRHAADVLERSLDER